MSAVETGQMSSVETRQMSAGDTGQMPAVETRQATQNQAGHVSGPWSKGLAGQAKLHTTLRK